MFWFYLNSLIKNVNMSWAPVAHACITSTWEAEITEDHGLQPAGENSSPDSISK
jgi:hypothetical protein